MWRMSVHTHAHTPTSTQTIKHVYLCVLYNQDSIMIGMSHFLYVWQKQTKDRTIILCVNGVAHIKRHIEMTTALHKNKTRPWTKMYQLFRHPRVCHNMVCACDARPRTLFTCDLAQAVHCWRWRRHWIVEKSLLALAVGVRTELSNASFCRSVISTC